MTTKSSGGARLRIPVAAADRPGRLDSVLGVSGRRKRLALLVAAVFLGTQSTHALASNTADTLFFARFGVEHLPVMYMALGFSTMAALVAYGVLLGRMSRRVLYPGLLVLGAASLVLGRIAIALDQRWVYAAVWLVASLGVLVTLTFMWTLASDVADARSAKRLFPIFASAGIFGGFVGNLATGPLTSLIGAPNVLLVTAAVMAMSGVVAARATTYLEIARRSEPARDAGMRSAFQMAFAHPLLRLVALAFFVGSALFYAVAFPFSTAVAESFESEAQIASFLGVFAAAATAVTFVVSLLLVNRVFARVGVILAWFLVGVVYVGGFGLWLVSLTLVTASTFRFAQWVMTTSIGSTARSATFNVLHPDQRAEVMAGFAAVPAQLGVVLGGLLLWAGTRAGELTNTIIGLVLALVLAWAVWSMRKHYSESLVHALRAGSLDAFIGASPGIAQLDAANESVAVALGAMQDEDPSVRRLAVEMLGHFDAGDNAEDFLAMLGDDDLEVRIAALEAIERKASSNAGSRAVRVDPELVIRAVTVTNGALDGTRAELQARAVSCLVAVGAYELAADRLQHLLASRQAIQRLAAVQAIARTGWEPSAATAAGVLATDPSQAVRAASAAAVAAVSGASTPLRTAMLDPSPTVRLAAARAWATVRGPPEVAVGMLEREPPHTWEAATIALGDRAGEVRERVLAWAVDELDPLVVLQGDRDAFAGIADIHHLPATEYLWWLMSQWVEASHRVAIRVLGLLESEETVRLIIDGIGATDVERRAQALEAAESLGGALGRRVVPLLEGSTVRPPPITAVIRRVAADDDPFARALALRCVMELAAREWVTVVTPLMNDPSPIVRSTAEDIMDRMEFDMGETLGTLSRMDRMLLLRRVSLFRELLPEDLDRLAELAAEYLYEDGEVMLARGELGGDLVVIVSGSCAIGPVGGDVIQHLAAGDHVGELTALSGGRRPTDAVAVGPVRALVISGATFSTLILDRPEVARLMLASLAERLAAVLEDGSHSGATRS